MKLKRRFDNVKGRRDWFGFFPDNAHCLPGIPRNAKNTERVLQVLCSFYNSFHSVKAKNCSFKTSNNRKTFILRFFRIVQTRFCCDPRNLQPKHVEYYFRIQIAKLKKKGASQHAITDTVRHEVGYLFFFARWIGKVGLINKADHYLKKNKIDGKTVPVLSVRASNISQEGKERLIKEAFDLDPILGALVLAIAQFGLRPREACYLKPMTAFDQNEEGWYLEITEGSKGGRPRRIQFRNQSQIWTMKILQETVIRLGTERIGYPHESPQQTVKRLNAFSREKLNLMRTGLQGSVYGLRHCFAQELLWELARIQPMHEAKEKVSEALGHGRPHITGVYVGSAVKLDLDVIKNFINLYFIETSEEEKINLGFQIIRQILYRDAVSGLFMMIHAFKSVINPPPIEIEFMKAISLLESHYFGKKPNNFEKRISKLLDIPEEDIGNLLTLMENKYSSNPE